VDQEGIQGVDQIEEFPAWICIIEFSCKIGLICKTEDQNTERGPAVEAVQKEEFV
jgi:hypothetical protein